MSPEKRDSPWFRSEVLNQKKKNPSNNTELKSKHSSALHLIQHKSEHSTDASTDAGAAEGPVHGIMGFFDLFLWIMWKFCTTQNTLQISGVLISGVTSVLYCELYLATQRDRATKKNHNNNMNSILQITYITVVFGLEELV